MELINIAESKDFTVALDKKPNRNGNRYVRFYDKEGNPLAVKIGSENAVRCWLSEGKFDPYVTIQEEDSLYAKVIDTLIEKIDYDFVNEKPSFEKSGKFAKIVFDKENPSVFQLADEKILATNKRAIIKDIPKRFLMSGILSLSYATVKDNEIKIVPTIESVIIRPIEEAKVPCRAGLDLSGC